MIVSLLACSAAFLTLCPSGAALADADAGLSEFREGRVAEALLEWRAGTDAGDSRSMLFLGFAYDTGAGLPQDFAAALDLYRRGGTAGNASAALDAALMYDAGRGTGRDPLAAAAWYRRAAALGSGRAAFNLGLMLQSGDRGLPADRAGSVVMFRRASQLGIPDARRRLAELGVPSPFPSAQPAAPQPGGDDAFRTLLERRTGAAPGQFSTLRRSAEAGDAVAAYNLAYCFERGLGVASDPAAAVRWYTKAAASGDARLADLARTAARRLGAEPPGS